MLFDIIGYLELLLAIRSKKLNHCCFELLFDSILLINLRYHLVDLSLLIIHALLHDVEQSLQARAFTGYLCSHLLMQLIYFAADHSLNLLAQPSALLAICSALDFGWFSLLNIEYFLQRLKCLNLFLTLSLQHCKYSSWYPILVFVLKLFLSVFLYFCSLINEHLLQLFKFVYLGLVEYIAYGLFSFYNFRLYLYKLLFTCFCFVCLINNPL